MILIADPDQRISEEITRNLCNVLHLVNIVNKDHCIFRDYKETPTPNVLCMCTDTFMCECTHVDTHSEARGQGWHLSSFIST